VGGAVEESLSQQAGIDATFAQLLALDPGLLSNIFKFRYYSISYRYIVLLYQLQVYSTTLSVTGI